MANETPKPPTDEAAKAPGWLSRTFGKGGAVRTNWNESSGWKKGARVAGTSVGVVLIGAGLVDAARLVGMASPKLDEDGKELPRGAGTLFKSLAELGAGAGAIYFSLIKGKAAGMAHG